NARLYEEEARKQRWLGATAEITALLSSGQPTHTALRTIAERALEVAGADVAWILSVDEEVLVPQAVAGDGLDLAGMAAIPVDRSLAGKVVGTGKPLSLEHLSTHVRE